MDAYEVHKKIQEAILAVEIYQMKTSVQSSSWHPEIVKGLDELSNCVKGWLRSPSPQVGLR